MRKERRGECEWRERRGECVSGERERMGCESGEKEEEEGVSRGIEKEGV